MTIHATKDLNLWNDYAQTIQVYSENGDSFSIDVDFSFSYIRTNPTIYVDTVVTQILEPVDDLYEPQYLSTSISLKKVLLIDDHEFVVNQDRVFKEFCENLMSLLEHRDDKNIELLKANNIRKVLKTVLKYSMMSVYGIVEEA